MFEAFLVQLQRDKGSGECALVCAAFKVDVSSVSSPPPDHCFWKKLDVLYQQHESDCTSSCGKRCDSKGREHCVQIMYYEVYFRAVFSIFFTFSGRSKQTLSSSYRVPKTCREFMAK